MRGNMVLGQAFYQAGKFAKKPLITSGGVLLNKCNATDGCIGIQSLFKRLIDSRIVEYKIECAVEFN